MWWKEAVVYQIYPRSFFDSDSNGIGDLEGIIQKLDYLNGTEDSLGVDAIWLSPINPSPMVDFGYDISDYKDIDPIFGSLSTFKKLIDEAHKRKIKIVMDLVVNHTSNQHPWFQESRSSINNPKRDWYIWTDPVNGKPPNNWLAAFGGNAWELDKTTNQYYYHGFTVEQPDLNWRNLEVQKEVFKIFKFWLDMGVDGFRLDVVNYYIKDKKLRSNPINLLKGLRPYDVQIHKYDRDRPKTHSILKKLRVLLDSYKGDRMSVGEVFIEPPGNPKLATSYLGEDNDELHMAFNFAFLYSSWNAEKFKQVILDSEESIGKGWPNYTLSNHDQIRHIGRYEKGKDTIPRAKLAALLLLTLRGTPFLYYGEEIGMEDQQLPKHLIQDPLGKKYWPIFSGRDRSRLPMCWSANKNAGFSESKPWLPINKNYEKVNVEAQLKSSTSLFHVYKTILNLRREFKALRKGSIEILESNKNILAYTRSYKGEILFIAINFTNHSQALQLKEKKVLSKKFLELFSTHSNLQDGKIQNIILKSNQGILGKIA